MENPHDTNDRRPLYIRMPQDIARQLKARAREEDRSMNAEILQAIRRHLQQPVQKVMA